MSLDLYPKDAQERDDFLVLLAKVWNLDGFKELTAGELLTKAANAIGCEGHNAAWNATHWGLNEGLTKLLNRKDIKK